MHEALHVRLRRGGEGRGGARRGGAWPEPGLAWPVLLFSGLCPGSAADWDGHPRSRASAPPTLPLRLTEGRRPPGSAARAGVKLPTDLGIGSWPGCGINTSIGSAFLRPIHEPGSGRTSVLLSAQACDLGNIQLLHWSAFPRSQNSTFHSPGRLPILFLLQDFPFFFLKLKKQNRNY